MPSRALSPRPRPRSALFGLLVCGSLALSAPAFAQSADEIKIARQTAGEGLQAYNAGEFEKALGLFTQARAVYPSAQIVRMLGYSELALEHWEKALVALEASLESKISPLGKEDKKEVSENIAKALSHIGTVTVTTKVKGAKLTVDGGEPMALPLEKPLRLNEGVHKLVVTAPEHLDATNDLKVEGGKPAEVAMEPPAKPKPKPPPPPPPIPQEPERKEWVPQQRLVGLAAMGGGVAFGAAALITMTQWVHWKGLAKTDYDAHVKNFGKSCQAGDRLCAYDVEITNREADTANSLRNASLGLGITAGVLAATGAVFFFLAPKKKAPAPPADNTAPPPEPPVVSFGCGPGGELAVICRGTF